MADRLCLPVHRRGSYRPRWMDIFGAAPMSAEDLEWAADAALSLADRCEAQANDFDDAWRTYCEAEAERHRERARWYRERAALLEAQVNYV
jgi:uncharacterized membrane-anchored protein